MPVSLVDPARIEPQSRNVLPVNYATCLKLVNHRPGGPRSGELVPEAAPWPRISPDGRTYTFMVRPRFTRFSNGERVGPANFARAINRLADPRIGSPGARLIEDIVGVFEVREGVARAIRGVRVRGSRLSILLRRRAPDFLARLAMPHFCSVATTHPARPQDPEMSIAAAGPYYVPIADGRRIVLRRNRYYRGPRRRGPTRIEVIRPTVGSALARVESGAIDVVGDARLESGETPRTARMRSVPLPSIIALVFNAPRGRPFANPRLRRAAALALDRLGTARGHGDETDALALSTSLGLRRVGAYPRRPTEQNRTRALELARGLVPVSVAGRNNTGALVNEDSFRASLKEVGIDAGFIRTADCGDEDADFYVISIPSDYGDPAAALRYISRGRLGRCNSAGFFDVSWRPRLARALAARGAARLRLLTGLETYLVRDDALLVGLYQESSRWLFSARVGCFRPHRAYQIDLASLCRR